MKPSKQVKEWFKMFRQIPPQSHFTGIDDKEAIECVKVLIDILIKETKGTIDSTGNYVNDGKYYLDCLKQLESIKVERVCTSLCPITFCNYPMSGIKHSIFPLIG